MQILDRVALIVRPKRRYVEWANRADPEAETLTLDAVRAQPISYLVAPDGDEEGTVDVQVLIDRWAERMFDDQLRQWTPDEATWPTNRTPHLFRDWFDVELVELVGDLDEDLPIFDGANEYSVEDATTVCAWCASEIGAEEVAIPVTVAVASEEALEIPPEVAIPWPVPAPHGVALATAPIHEIPHDSGTSPVTFHVCGDPCAEALRAALAQPPSASTAPVDQA